MESRFPLGPKEITISLSRRDSGNCRSVGVFGTCFSNFAETVTPIEGSDCTTRQRHVVSEAGIHDPPTFASPVPIIRNSVPAGRKYGTWIELLDNETPATAVVEPLPGVITAVGADVCWPRRYQTPAPAARITAPNTRANRPRLPPFFSSPAHAV